MENAFRQKILAADGVIGVVIMLSYYAGKHNLFPPNINPSMYLLEERLEYGAVMTDLDLLSDLIKEVANVVGQKFGELQPGSVPVYLCALRRGHRANFQGSFPPVKNQYSKVSKKLIIYPRDLARDQADGTAKLIPSWIRFR